MPHRIIQPCIVRAVKPYQLVAALMAREGLGPLPLAKKMGHVRLQPQIHRFSKGEVAEPAPSTAKPLAAYFKLPLEAMYDEKVATAVARERGITELPAQLPAAKKRAAKQQPFDEDTMRFAAAYQKLNPEERHRLRLLLQVARTGKQPDPEVWSATGRDASQPPDPFLGDSDFGGLEQEGAASRAVIGNVDGSKPTTGEKNGKGNEHRGVQSKRYRGGA
jgi:hypothetical protein